MSVPLPGPGSLRGHAVLWRLASSLPPTLGQKMQLENHPEAEGCAWRAARKLVPPSAPPILARPGAAMTWFLPGPVLTRPHCPALEKATRVPAGASGSVPTVRPHERACPPLEGSRQLRPHSSCSLFPPQDRQSLQGGISSRLAACAWTCLRRCSSSSARRQEDSCREGRRSCCKQPPPPQPQGCACVHAQGSIPTGPPRLRLPLTLRLLGHGGGRDSRPAELSVEPFLPPPPSLRGETPLIPSTARAPGKSGSWGLLPPLRPKARAGVCRRLRRSHAVRSTHFHRLTKISFRN